MLVVEKWLGEMEVLDLNTGQKSKMKLGNPLVDLDFSPETGMLCALLEKGQGKELQVFSLENGQLREKQRLGLLPWDFEQVGVLGAEGKVLLAGRNFTSIINLQRESN